ncbi:MAG: pirin family protein [Deltaproteobacteria bacterium]|nr:pirin family protein [Deltaproteobacteria bacterium]
MIAIRPSESRGVTRIGWLDSKHSFSFGDYYDPAHMGFRALRVINEDRVAAGQGFGRHPHKNMEIVSYVVSGALAHRDSMGTGSVIRPGEVQRMSAGTGVQHSEMNPDPSTPVHFLQIWLLPERQGIEPSYEQKAFADEDKRGKLRLVASRDGREGSVTVHTDASVYATLLEPGERVVHSVPRGRHAWIQVVRGAVSLSGARLSQGDGAAVSADDEALTIELVGREPAEALVFDLA